MVTTAYSRWLARQKANQLKQLKPKTRTREAWLAIGREVLPGEVPLKIILAKLYYAKEQTSPVLLNSLKPKPLDMEVYDEAITTARSEYPAAIRHTMGQTQRSHRTKICGPPQPKWRST